MKDKEAERVDVLLVGYENHENLGLRSIMAYLLQEGHRVALAPFFPGMHDAVLEAARRHRPRVIGFSLIFQYALEQFGTLMRALRTAGVDAHFTAGGQPRAGGRGSDILCPLADQTPNIFPNSCSFCCCSSASFNWNRTSIWLNWRCSLSSSFSQGGMGSQGMGRRSNW